MWISLGYVTVPAGGTPIRSTANESNPPARIAAHSIFFQQKSSNSGKVYICSSATANRTTGEDVLAVLSIPTTNLLPSASVTVTYAPNGFNVADFWVDVDVDGDAVLVSYVQA